MSFALNIAASSSAGLSLPALSDAEAAALEVPELVARISSRELCFSELGLAYDETVRGEPFASLGGVFASTVGGLPASRHNAGALAILTGKLQLPPSYSIYMLAQINGAADFETLFASRDTSGAKQWLFMDAARRARLIHATTEILTTENVALNQNFVLFAGYDLPTTTGAIRLNSASAPITGTLPAHKGQPESAIGGILASGVGTNVHNGYIIETLVFRGSHAAAGYNATRAAIMGWLAAYGGVTLS